MRIRKRGRTGLKVSNLCLGAMTFGNQQWGCDEATSKAIVDRFLEAGGNFIDTADIYSAGVSEEITGTAIRDNLRRVAQAPGTHVKYNQFAKALDLLKKGKNVNYQGVSGPITFDKKGDVKEAAIEIWMVRKGKTISLWIVPM